MRFGEKKAVTVMDFGSFGLSIKEAAAHWQIHPIGLWRLISQGKVRASRCGRSWRVSQVEIDRIESFEPETWVADKEPSRMRRDKQ